MSRITATSLVALLSLFVAVGADAQMQITVGHTGPFGETQQFVHTIGGSNQVFDSFGFNYFVASPVTVAGADFAMSIDFTSFAYTDFAGESGSISITGYPDYFFAVLLQNQAEQVISFANYNGTTISATWLVDDVLAAGNTLYVAWVVPAPAGVSVFAGAALMGLRRRR